MEKLEEFTFYKEDGTKVEAKVLGCFTVVETGKTFLLYNAGDDDSVDASLVLDKGNVLELKEISAEDEEAVEQLVTNILDGEVN